MKHHHSVHKIIEREGIRVGECICNARKVLIEGVPTSWVAGYYREKNENRQENNKGID